MMHNTKSAIIRRVLVYAVMVTAVLALTTTLLLLMLGYRYNKNDNAIVQGGLVQFISQPSGASVRVGTADLAGRTRSKITLNPGDYKVVMSRDGYMNWEKNIDVQPGKVLWLNSARLLPTNPVTEPIVSEKTIASVAMQENGQKIALLKDAAKPDITVIQTNDDTVVPKTVVLPTSAYTEATKHQFSLVKQSGDNNHILLKHVFDKDSEWIVLNEDSPVDSYAIPVDKKNPIISIQFDPSSDSRAYLLFKDGSLRRLSVEDGTQSSVLIQQVADFTLTSTGSLFYVTLPQKGIVTTGYLTQGKTIARTIDSYPTDKVVHIAAGEYYGDFYIVTSRDNTAEIRSYDIFPASDEAVSTVTPDKTTTVATAGAITSLAFKNNGRLVALQQARRMTTYDIELQTQADIPLEGVKKDLSAPLQWLDSFHFWNDATGSARQYEYDGTNQVSITAVASGYPAAYSANNKYFYSVGKTKDGFALQRTRIVL